MHAARSVERARSFVGAHTDKNSDEQNEEKVNDCMKLIIGRNGFKYL